MAICLKRNDWRLKLMRRVRLELKDLFIPYSYSAFAKFLNHLSSIKSEDSAYCASRWGGASLQSCWTEFAYMYGSLDGLLKRDQTAWPAYAPS